MSWNIPWGSAHFYCILLYSILFHDLPFSCSIMFQNIPLISISFHHFLSALFCLVPGMFHYLLQCSMTFRHVPSCSVKFHQFPPCSVGFHEFPWVSGMFRTVPCYSVRFCGIFWNSKSLILSNLLSYLISLSYLILFYFIFNFMFHLFYVVETKWQLW